MTRFYSKKHQRVRYGIKKPCTDKISKKKKKSRTRTNKEDNKETPSRYLI